MKWNNIIFPIIALLPILIFTILLIISKNMKYELKDKETINNLEKVAWGFLLIYPILFGVAFFLFILFFLFIYFFDNSMIVPVNRSGVELGISLPISEQNQSIAINGEPVVIYTV